MTRGQHGIGSIDLDRRGFLGLVAAGSVTVMGALAGCGADGSGSDASSSAAGTFAYTKHLSLTTTSSTPSSRSSPASRFASSNCSLLLGHTESLSSSLGVLTAMYPSSRSITSIETASLFSTDMGHAHPAWPSHRRS